MRMDILLVTSFATSDDRVVASRGRSSAVIRATGRRAGGRIEDECSGVENVRRLAPKEPKTEPVGNARKVSEGSLVDRSVIWSQVRWNFQLEIRSAGKGDRRKRGQHNCSGVARRAPNTPFARSPSPRVVSLPDVSMQCTPPSRTAMGGPAPLRATLPTWMGFVAVVNELRRGEHERDCEHRVVVHSSALPPCRVPRCSLTLRVCIRAGSGRRELALQRTVQQPLLAMQDASNSQNIYTYGSV
jgi:hypothetical protein